MVKLHRVKFWRLKPSVFCPGSRVASRPLDLARTTGQIYSRFMRIFLHRLRDNGWPIPKYQFAFKPPLVGDLVVLEQRDDVLNRYTRAAKFTPAVPDQGHNLLLDAQLVELSSTRLVLSGIERQHDQALSRIVDYAQTWVGWLSDEL